MSILKFLFVVLTLSVAEAQTLLGNDALGANKYRRSAISSIGKNEAFGFFLRTFGDARSLVPIAAKRAKFVRVHSEPFDPSHKYPITRTVLNRVISDYLYIQKISSRYPNTVFGFSPFCEHLHNSRVMARLFSRLRRISPPNSNVILVNSPLKMIQNIEGTYLEYHYEIFMPIDKSRIQVPYLVSLDGFRGYDRRSWVRYLRRYHRDAFAFLYHRPEYNGRRFYDDKLPIPLRVNYPDKNLLLKGKSYLR